MTIETLYRAKCDPCERYLPIEHWPKPAVVSTTMAATFIDFSSAYAGAIERGWSAWPLVCPECATDLKEKVQRVEVRTDRGPEEDGRGIPQGDQGAERTSGVG